MMGGLAYMTGPPGQPLRAGASVNDIMGGMFGVIAIQAALAERTQTGRGRHIQSALFENNVFLMAQAMMYEAVTGKPSIPYSIKDSPWPVYDLFDTKDGAKIFVTVVGEEHWEALCRNFGREAWLGDPQLATMQGRVDQRARVIAELRTVFAQWTMADLARKLDGLGLPYAPVNKPGDLFDDPHLNGSGGLAEIRLLDGRTAKTPMLPIAIDGARLDNRRDPPQVGADTRDVLSEIGYGTAEIDALARKGAITLREPETTGRTT
jgi:crotonobetainyl-CoA:carnitine CoA-transferase CaiB-like acyl-CoA transferase